MRPSLCKLPQVAVTFDFFLPDGMQGLQAQDLTSHGSSAQQRHT